MFRSIRMFRTSGSFSSWASPCRTRSSRIGRGWSGVDSEQLIARGRLQSIDTLEVLLFLEEKYGIDFGEIGFDQNQVESIDNIMALIDGK